MVGRDYEVSTPTRYIEMIFFHSTTTHMGIYLLIICLGGVTQTYIAPTWLKVKSSEVN